MKNQVDAALAIGAGRDCDEIDEAVQQRAGLLGRCWVARDDCRHVIDLAAIVLDDCRMRDHRFDFGEVALVGQKGFAPIGQILRAHLQLVGRDAGDDRVGDAFFSLIDFGQLDTRKNPSP
jgi:hypothetical protein